MHVGLSIFATEYAMPIVELAREAEARGFDSLYVPEHTHIPTSRRSPWPGGAELPRQYWHTLDPFVALAAVAAATTRLRLGTGICLLTERDPIVTAKEVASLDVVSGGRVEFGIGAGWNAEEMENHGTAFDTRFRLMRDRALALKCIWTEEEPSYRGEFVAFDPIWSYPKPVQKPHPPILLGGETKYTMRRVAEFCDGWFPRARDFDPVAGLARMRAVAESAGRAMDTISVTVFGTAPQRRTLDAYAEAGITRALLSLPSEGRDTVLPLLDEYAALLG